MPTYEYRCDACGMVTEVSAGMRDDHTPPPCPKCLHATRRVFGAAFHCDEIRGTSYFHPTQRKDVKDHGRVFDMGLGQWYSTKAERKRLIKKRGFQEHGIREV